MDCRPIWLSKVRVGVSFLLVSRWNLRGSRTHLGTCDLCWEAQGPITTRGSPQFSSLKMNGRLATYSFFVFEEDRLWNCLARKNKGCASGERGLVGSGRESPHFDFVTCSQTMRELLLLQRAPPAGNP